MSKTIAAQRDQPHHNLHIFPKLRFGLGDAIRLPDRGSGAIGEQDLQNCFVACRDPLRTRSRHNFQVGANESNDL